MRYPCQCCFVFLISPFRYIYCQEKKLIWIEGKNILPFLEFSTCSTSMHFLVFTAVMWYIIENLTLLVKRFSIKARHVGEVYNQLLVYVLPIKNKLIQKLRGKYFIFSRTFHMLKIDASPIIPSCDMIFHNESHASYQTILHKARHAWIIIPSIACIIDRRPFIIVMQYCRLYYVAPPIYIHILSKVCWIDDINQYR